MTPRRLSLFTTRDLLARGFRKHGRLSTFFGYCAACGTYRSIAWWQTPEPDNHQTVACEQCGTVPESEWRFIWRYPVLDQEKSA